MKIYDTDTYSFKIDTANATGGKTISNYRIGDTVPNSLLHLQDTDCNSYSIFPYTTDDYILFITNGVFTDAVHYLDLKDDHIFGLSCYSIDGVELDIDYVRDYIALRETHN